MTAIVLGAAYLAGTFPTASTVARAYGHDVTAEGSGNPGASNVYRIAGKRAGIVVFLGDLLKGVAASALGLVVAGRPLAVAAGIAAVVGHCFPVLRREKGGKGVAAGCGMLLVCHPVVTAVVLPFWVLLARVTKRASVASLVAAVAAPTGVFLSRDEPWEGLAVLGLSALIVARHVPNLLRLARGEESTIPVGDG